MFKKLIVILVLFFIVVAGLQLFGGRDFTQVTVAWDKYQYGGTLSGLGSDIVTIFTGDKINQGGLSTAKLAERIIYRWTDEQGVVHHSERMPGSGIKYETISMGELNITVQKSLDKEEIKKALNNN